MNKSALLAAEHHVRVRSGEQILRFTVPTMGSDHCAGIVSAALKRLPGVSGVQAYVGDHRVEVRFDPPHARAETLKVAIEQAGYEVGATDAKEPTASKERVAPNGLGEEPRQLHLIDQTSPRTRSAG